MSDAVLDAPTPEVPDPPVRSRPLLSWPPPGLNRIQGDLWKATRELGAGGAILVLPLLWVTVSEASYWSFGPLGDSWWVVLITSFVGLMIVITGFVDLFRLLRRSAAARARGYGATTILMVLTDAAREAGFVLQGSRSFSAFGSGARRRILRVRIWMSLATFAGALWLTVGFVLGVFLGSRGVLGPGGLAFLVLVPPALLGLTAVALRAWDQRMVRRARRAWFHQPWTQDLVTGEIQRWQEEAQRLTSQVGLVRPSTGSVFGFTAAAVAVAVVALVVVSFSVILSATSAVSPAMARISMPDFSLSQERAARAEFLRRYALPPDETMTPQEAGQAFHVLSYVGDPTEREMELVPSRIYEEPWYSDAGSGNPTGMAPQYWSDDLFPALAAGEIDAEGMEYLASVADHPAHEEIARAAVAPSADLSGARYRVPFPEGTTMWELPIPRYQPLREGAYAHIARAGYLADQGRMAEAERTLRQVISAGLRLADEGPFIIDNLLGLHMADAGARALVGFYEYAGRTDDAEILAWVRETSRHAAEVGRLGTTPSPSSMLTRMPEIVTDSTALRGLRWDFLTTMNTLSPCLNPHRMVFGPGPQYDDWLDDARASMVRYPGEAEMFELGTGGVFGRKGSSAPTALRAVLAIPMGGGESAGSCARLFQAVNEF